MNSQLLDLETNVRDGQSTGEETSSTAHRLSFTDVVLTTVKPLQKTTHDETIDPTSVDLPSADDFCPMFFAYRLEDKSEAFYSQMVKRLKESLQKVLVQFFSFAGRWIDSPLGSSSRKLLCNDEGVPFVEAYLDKDLDSIVRASAAFQPIVELQGYDVLGMDGTQFRQEMQPGGLPCIFIQVTHFKCGGVVLAVTFNHMHTDAKGCFNFLRAWSDLSRTSETTMKVEHNRALAEPKSFKNFLAKHKTPETPSAENGIDGQGCPAKLGLWDMRAFEVSASVIKSLKQEAKGNRDGPGFVSTGDCIIGHLSKAFARLSSSMLGRELALSMAVEGRSKFFDPPLPNLCGNAVAALVAPRIPPRELQEMSVASIASKLREKLHTTTREEWLGLERLEEAFLVSRSSQLL